MRKSERPTESREARRRDWAKFKEGRLTPAEATVLDTERRRKLRAMLLNPETESSAVSSRTEPPPMQHGI